MAYISSNTQIPTSTLKGIIILITVCTVGYSQQKLSTESKKAESFFLKANKSYKDRDFDAAIEALIKATKADTTFYEAYATLGRLFMTMGNEDSSYHYLQYYMRHTKKMSQGIAKSMVLMAFDRGEYKKATQYLKVVKKTKMPDHEMDRVQASLVYINADNKEVQPLQIIVLPPEINQYSLQYLPSITVDNGSLIFTKRDFYSDDEDIVISYKRNGRWTKAQPISDRINTRMNEGASTVSADGKLMVLTSCDRQDSFGSCDLYYSVKSASGWSKPKNLGKKVNSSYWESQPSLSADGRKLYFASSRTGGHGGRDIWVSEKLGQEWNVPVNMGNVVNSWKDDTTPFIHSDGETLYFSSNSRPGFGGFDIYRTKKLDSVWTKPTNLGKQINSHKDEVGLLIAPDGKTAYFSQEKTKNGRIEESLLASFILPDELTSASVSFIIGRIFDEETKLPLKAKVEIVEVRRTEILFTYESDSLTGEYLMVLPNNKALAGYIKKKGYVYSNFKFSTTKNSLRIPDTIDVYLKPIEVGEQLILKNIFFEHDSYELDERSNSEISSVVELLEQNNKLRIEIEGHTDNVGSNAYNQELSEKRAKAVFRQLIKNGISENRVTFKGYGSTRPIGSNEDASGRQTNRRIEFRIIRK